MMLIIFWNSSEFDVTEILPRDWKFDIEHYISIVLNLFLD
jgi:hypothetical protein